jgi:hypothetical protein
MTSLRWWLPSLVLVLVACQSTPTPPPVSGPTITVTAADGVVMHRGSVAFFARPSSTAGQTEWVINLPNTGELLVDPDNHRCRLVTTTAAVTDLRVWQAFPCAVELRDAGTRICLRDQRMTSPSALAVVVDGCADRNELRIAGIEDRAALGVGPRAQTERCASLPTEPYNYLRLQKIDVEGNRDPLVGARFRHDGDGFLLCFLAPLQRAHATWMAEVWVEAPIAGPTVLKLGGDILDL